MAVLVAKVRMPAWQPIKEPEKFFEVKQYPQDIAPKKALGDFAEVKDQRFKNFIDEGKAVTQDDLVSKDQSGLDYEAAARPARHRHQGNGRDRRSAASSCPGSRVDVVCTVRGGDSVHQADPAEHAGAGRRYPGHQATPTPRPSSARR